jgi:hypothetical protein
MLKEVRMDDVPEDPMMSHISKGGVRRRIGEAGSTTTAEAARTTTVGAGRRHKHGDDGPVVSEHGCSCSASSRKGSSTPTEERVREVDPQNNGPNAASAVHQPFALGTCLENL